MQQPEKGHAGIFGGAKASKHSFHQQDDQLQRVTCENDSRLWDFPVFSSFSRAAALPFAGLKAGGRKKGIFFFSDSHLQQNDNPGAPWTALVCNEFGSDSLLVHSEIASELLTRRSK